MRTVLSGFLGLALCVCSGCGGGTQKAPLAVHPPSTTIQVTITSPQASASVGTSFSVSAQASGATIAGWEIDVDGSSAYTAGAVASINAALNITAGSHSLMVKAWDSKGNIGQQTLQISATAPTILVTITSPKASATVDTTFSVAANASGSSISGWEVDIDGSKTYSGAAGASLSANVTTAAGSHHVLVKAWDAEGNSGSQTVDISAAAPPKNPLPTPPSTAVVFKDIQQMTTGWGSCGASNCAGGSGSGSYWQAFNQTTPSLSGSSMELYRDGVYGDSLWWRHMGAQSSATNMLWDFYMQLDDASTNSVQALEYDSYQFLDGYNYMVGSQCDYPAGVWETWDEANDKWIKTAIVCKKFTTNTWHHIQWYVTLDHSAHTYTYVTLVVDGNAYSVNQTFGAKYNGWHNNIGVQWQLDVNKSGGGYHEWVDKANFTVW